MENKQIKDLLVEDKVTSFFAVRKKTVREFTKGQYLTLELGDASGRINAVMWEPDQFCLNELTEGMVVKVRGVVGEYNNKKQIVINLMRLAKDDEYAPEQILAYSREPVEHRKARIMDLIDKTENSYIKQLLEAFFKDEKFLSDYLTAPAGKLWHHACIGGLSEHSANVAELALRAAAGYDFLNKDYLIFGGLLHDVGKISQYSTGMVIDYTDEGRLVGHICTADNWICRTAETIEAFPEKLLMKLRHIILSHQGELEYATPVVPQMPEAFIVYYCDEIDSKMGAIERIRERHDGKGWSDYVNLINRYLYFGEDDDAKQ